MYGGVPSTPARRGKAPTCVATQDGVEFVGLTPEKTIVLVGLMGAAYAMLRTSASSAYERRYAEGGRKRQGAGSVPAAGSTA